MQFCILYQLTALCCAASAVGVFDFQFLSYVPVQSLVCAHSGFCDVTIVDSWL